MGASVQPSTGSTAPHDWGEWAVQHTRQIIYVAAGILILIGAVWLYITSERRKEAFASQALSAARTDAESGNLPLAANDLTRMIDRYSGTRAADDAVILLNQVRLVEGGTQVGLVVSDLQSFVKGSHPDYILASAWALLGAAFEQENRYKDAAPAYAEAAKAATHDFLKAEYLLDQGRTLAIAGDSAAARTAYTDVIEKYGQLAQAQEARVRLGQLGGSLPASQGKPAS